LQQTQTKRTDEPPQLITIGVIAAELGVPLHRVRHVLRTRPYIRPAAKAGQARLFDTETVAQVRHALNAIDAKRCRGPADVEGGRRAGA
jgi:hypothetical protein